MACKKLIFAMRNMYGKLPSVTITDGSIVFDTEKIRGFPFMFSITIGYGAIRVYPATPQFFIVEG